jgi:uncharacterized protein (TIGR03382 family)
VYVRADSVVAWIEHLTSRKLARAACDRPADDPGSAATASGCSAGAGAGILVTLAVLVWVLTLRRRR